MILSVHCIASSQEVNSPLQVYKGYVYAPVKCQLRHDFSSIHGKFSRDWMKQHVLFKHKNFVDNSIQKFGAYFWDICSIQSRQEIFWLKMKTHWLIGPPNRLFSIAESYHKIILMNKRYARGSPKKITSSNNLKFHQCPLY